MTYFMNINASRLLTGFFLIFAPVLTVMASLFYPGSKVLFIIYGLLTTCMLVSIFIKQNGYFPLFFFSFLILGCWLKTMFHFLFNTNFIEPVGLFSGLPEEWDIGLLILNVAFVSLLICYWISTVFTRKEKFVVQSFNSSKYILALLVFSFTAAMALLFFNYQFSILKIGTEPLIKLPSSLYSIIAFMVAWGNAILISALVYWLIKSERIKPCWMFYLLSVLGMFTSISMGSRVQMILYTAAPFILYFYKVSPLDKKFNKNEWRRIIIVTGLLFIATLLSVFADRYKNFPHESNHRYPFCAQSLNEFDKLIVKRRSFPHSKLNEYNREYSYMKPKHAYNRLLLKYPFLAHSLNQLNKLIVDRWIGVEGVLAVSSAPRLGTKLFQIALFEDPRRGNDAIYQKISGSFYKKFKNFVFMTIPGPIAFLYFSGSLLVVALGMALLYFVGYFIENLANILVKNEAVNAIIGIALAYLFVQLNFPITLYYFLIELIVFLVGLALLQKIIASSDLYLKIRGFSLKNNKNYRAECSQ